MIDAEHSYFQPAIDHAAMEVQRTYNKRAPTIYNTYQCYLKDSHQRWGAGPRATATLPSACGWSRHPMLEPRFAEPSCQSGTHHACAEVEMMQQGGASHCSAMWSESRSSNRQNVTGVHKA